ncbi:MAG TPA: UDP-2,3-diacylglucosamine diphosphatase [Burkholderiaceae bacterium]|nr:UDP-2,3-diacylglucosamine diphosphatase [Burkholderiaceae bacterium]
MTVRADTPGGDDGAEFARQLTEGSASLAVARDERALFASDVHLSPREPQTAQWFLQALQRHGREADHLFLLGDLFEVWVGDDDDEPLGAQLLEVLTELSGRGVRVRLMRGNRDFLLDSPLPGAATSPFSVRCGAMLLPDPVTLDLHGTRTVLTHGDALCTDDVGYQAWRRTCRDPRWQQAFLSRTLAERRALARHARDHSESDKSGKAEYLMDVNPLAVLRLFDASGADLMIHGHTHRPASHRLEHAGRTLQRTVLTDWDSAARRGAMLWIERGEQRLLQP